MGGVCFPAQAVAVNERSDVKTHGLALHSRLDRRTRDPGSLLGGHGLEPRGYVRCFCLLALGPFWFGKSRRASSSAASSAAAMRLAAAAGYSSRCLPPAW